MVNFFGYFFKKSTFILGVFDILVCATGFYIYAWYGLASTNSTTPESISPYFLSLVTGIILWGLLFATGINNIPKTGKISSYLVKMIVVFFLSLPIIVPLWWASEFEYGNTPLLTIPAIFVQLSILLIIRILLLKFLPKDFDIENILILANTQEVKKIKDIIHNAPYDYKICRILDLSHIRLFNKFDVTQYCLKNSIDRIIIGRIDKRERVSSLINIAFSGITIIDIDTFREQQIGKVNLDRFYNYTTLIHCSFRPARINVILKRVFDFLFSLSLLILSSPIFLLIALLIKLEDRGSIFYQQVRTGLNGKDFKILKFRSMQEDAEKNGIQWAQSQDSRITKVGHFLRQTRLDELPQLINILKNDMSIVGPRPERPEFIVDLKKKIPLYTERLRIKPGLTGWAQINAGYAASEDDTREKLEYDLYYLKHFNPSLDLLIVLKTISVVLWPKKVH